MAQFQVKLGNSFEDFSKEENDILSHAFSTGNQNVEYTARGQKYQVDLRKMMQKNTASGKVRQIRIAPPPSQLVEVYLERPLMRGNASGSAARDMVHYGGAPKVRGSPGGLWPECRVYYKIADTVEDDLKDMIGEAISEFHAKTPIRWIQDCSKNYFVEFVQNNRENPHAHVGCFYQKGGENQKISCPYPNYPNGGPLKVVCIMHEMCHCIGLCHEHSRKDRDQHVRYACGTEMDHNFEKKGVRFGNYDYYSIMHYGHGAGGLVCKTEELRERADAGITFSAGDLAVIKKLYNGRFGHHGDWHRACTGRECTVSSCACGACGPLHGGVNCGYAGSRGHWTCCMSEDPKSICDSTHTGFWHAPCERGCTEDTCYCNNCGGGCTYEGSKGHWSCCNQEKFRSKCLHSPFQTDA